MIAPPDPLYQVAFLQQLQRLLADGGFVATYKYALLHALADLAIKHGEDSRAPLRLGTRAIAEQMVELYWRQALSFPGGGREAPAVLRQNTGRQATILVHIQEAQARFGASLVRCRASSGGEWSALVREAERVLKVMPLWKLQTVGDERLSFLYDNLDRGSEITLKPGVAYCLRAFHPLVLDLVRGAWLRFVRRHNPEALNEQAELSAFLFGSERAALARIQPVLAEIQSGRCFYCHRPLTTAGAVDHFIPWARYPTDLGHNFVLAHERCNGAKSDHLADEAHLERWFLRNETHDQIITDGMRSFGFAASLETSSRVAYWAYGLAARTGASVWTEGRRFIALSPRWEQAFQRYA